jgi:hypothetical protein
LRVTATGAAQECARVFTGTRRDDAPASVAWLCFATTERRVTCYYFYLWDEEFGPAAFQGPPSGLRFSGTPQRDCGR